MDVVAKLDNELRDEMVEMQSSITRWITETKQLADAVVLQAEMPMVLLGNSFLSRFTMRRDSDTMRLERR